VTAMPESVSDLTGEQVDQLGANSAPTSVVERFLELLRLGDVDGAVELLAVDVEYKNVGLPTVHGRERTRRLFRATLGRAGATPVCAPGLSLELASRTGETNPSASPKDTGHWFRSRSRSRTPVTSHCSTDH
jgi:hypothetical protein